MKQKQLHGYCPADLCFVLAYAESRFSHDLNSSYWKSFSSSQLIDPLFISYLFSDNVDGAHTWKILVHITSPTPTIRELVQRLSTQKDHLGSGEYLDLVKDM